MSDVILYAALKENQKLNTELLDICTGSSVVDESFYQSSDNQPGYPYGAGEQLNPSCPQVVKDWETTLKPLVKVNEPNGFKVWDTTYYRCGVCCSWTVPTGVSRVQFQMWGAGGGTSSNCCCGGAPFGASGAYQVVTMDVTPGNSYTLCAGCAYCCYASQNTPGGQGCGSYVCGPGLFACAKGGYPCYCRWNCDLQSVNSHNCGNQIPDPNGNGCGPNSCSGWNFCWDSNADDVEVCHAFSSCATFATPCLNTSCNPVVYGINGLWPHMYIPSANLCGGCTLSTPVFGFEGCVCQVDFCGSSCSGCCFLACNGYLQIPAAGGYASAKASGCNACYGDAGRGGMVCVSWTCD